MSYNVGGPQRRKRIPQRCEKKRKGAKGEGMQKTKLCLTDTDLNAYLSGTLSPEKKAEVEGHLASCSGCLEKVVFAYQTVEEFNKTTKSLPTGSANANPCNASATSFAISAGSSAPSLPD